MGFCMWLAAWMSATPALAAGDSYEDWNTNIANRCFHCTCYPGILPEGAVSEEGTKMLGLPVSAGHLRRISC